LSDTDTAAVAIELLGRPRVFVTYPGREAKKLPGPRLARSWLLLARVLQGELERDDLIEILWDGTGHNRTSSLDAVTYWARKALGPARDALVSKSSVGLVRDHLPEEVTLTSDVEAFYDLAARNNPALARELVRLYRGPLLSGSRLDQAGKQWVEGERTRQKRQLRRHLTLIFPEADSAELETYVEACHRGEAGKVADLALDDQQEPDPPPQPANAIRRTQKAPIGVIAPVSAWPTTFYTNIIKGVRSGAESDDPDRRRRILVFDVAREDIDEIDAVIASALEQDVQGLIALNAGWSNHARQTMHRRGRRVVSVMVEDLSPPVCCSVLLDNEPVADLIRHVLEPPCVAAVLVTPPPFDRLKRNTIDFARNDKRQAYETLAAKAGLELAPVRTLDTDLPRKPFEPGCAYVIEIPSYETAIGEQVFEAVAESLPPNTAVMFLNDWQAASFLSACNDSGRSAIERALRVSAYEDTDVAKWQGISTVDPRLEHIGRLAYERLQEALEDRSSPYRTEIIPGVVRLRQSTEWATAPDSDS
jgi:DNA-binding LacI/PurR family transcriptional regulator